MTSQMKCSICGAKFRIKGRVYPLEVSPEVARPCCAESIMEWQVLQEEQAKILTSKPVDWDKELRQLWAKR